MKQVVQNFRSGELKVEDVPAPIVRPGFVLVRNRHSLISSGTEGGTFKLGQMNLLQKAKARPEQVKKVINVVRTDGLLAAYKAVSRSLEIPIPFGYCCAGEVIQVGDGVTDLVPGQRVACGGAGWANHAEIVNVPRNLVVGLPDHVSTEQGAFTTLGSIAMQSVRVADARVGENVVVIGLGLVGLVAAQILKAAGCRIFGIDVDPQRVELARRLEICEGCDRGASNLELQVKAWSGGLGADSVLVTAPAPSNDPVALAGDLARYKGRVVVVGRTEMHAPRETYLFKELELCTSLAYGPGTGDPSYEEGGHDYPVGYVRWTENRNMQSFVELIAQGRLDLESITTHTFPIDEAERAFEMVTGRGAESPLAVLLEYESKSAPPARRISLTPRRVRSESDLGVGVIGAGSFATTSIVPILSKLDGIRLRGIASAHGLKARSLGEQYGFEVCVSDGGELIDDPEVHGVMILTRHDSHAPLTVRALEAGKDVFVEKPLAMSHGELEAVVKAAQRGSEAEQGGHLVQVGFNRRYAPLAIQLKRFYVGRAQPMSITFRSNVGFRPPEHWLHDPVQGGGVILGEAVHFVDFCHWLVEAPPIEVTTTSLDGEATGLINADNVHITLRFADGSVATIVYSSNGDPMAGRERVEVMAEGSLATLDDFRRLKTVCRGRSRTTRRLQDKGYRRQMKAMAESWRTGEPAVRLEESALSMLATLEAVASLESREPRMIDPGTIGL
ncbi:MAG: bi-domain-containing oxidoreductase [Thermoanaerobaculia bacterium]|nr:bi-domain-containing oxidoreductase [Thermoanaerobaculia bacterium]